MVHNMKVLGHLKTILHHKNLVRKHCFEVGLYRQGLFHDLSKYTPSEFIMGAKYYQNGVRSPNFGEKEARGYSSAWLHHKGRNKHHFEYWIDYPIEPDNGLQGMKMPLNYIIEMFIVRIAASKTYNKKHYTDADALLYYEKNKNHYVLHPYTQETLEYLLHMLAKEGEEKTFTYIRTELLKKGKC